MATTAAPWFGATDEKNDLAQRIRQIQSEPLDRTKTKKRKSDERISLSEMTPAQRLQALRGEPIRPCEETFRHSGWKHKRKLVTEALFRSGMGELSFERFLNCGSECIVEMEVDEGGYRLRANYCHCRHCEPCMRSKANIMRVNLINRLDQDADGRYRFLTLTLKHSETPLRDQIKRLYRSLRTIRKSKLWKNNVLGGAAFLEVKYERDAGEWHPHLHAVIEGSFLDQRCLPKNGWPQQATRISSIFGAAMKRRCLLRQQIRDQGQQRRSLVRQRRGTRMDRGHQRRPHVPDVRNMEKIEVDRLARKNRQLEKNRSP